MRCFSRMQWDQGNSTPERRLRYRSNTQLPCSISASPFCNFNSGVVLKISYRDLAASWRSSLQRWAKRREVTQQRHGPEPKDLIKILIMPEKVSACTPFWGSHNMKQERLQIVIFSLLENSRTGQWMKPNYPTLSTFVRTLKNKSLKWMTAVDKARLSGPSS